VYEKIDLIHEDKRELMIADLRERTGLNVTKVDIQEINYLRDTVKAKIYYTDESGTR